MGDRRMFSKVVIGTDDFLDMPVSAKLLYFYLISEADDDGFVDRPKAIIRQIGVGTDDLKILLAKQYVIAFETGVIVIRHWKVHNLVRKDMYKPTKHTDERSVLRLENDIYCMMEHNVTDSLQECNGIVTDLLQGGNELVTDSLQECSLSKDKINKYKLNKGTTTTTIPTTEAAGSRCSDEDWEAVRAVYENNINPVSGEIEMQKLSEDISHYGKDAVIKAIEVAVTSNRRKLSYIEGVLKNWETNGYGQGTGSNRKQGNGNHQREKIDWSKVPQGWGNIEELINKS